MPSAAASSAVPATDLLRLSVLMDAMANSTLMMLAGRCRPCGSRAAMTAPLFRSATSHASAERSPGTGGVSGAVTIPQLFSAAPPTGLGGTASGIGGLPVWGTSDESTAGGVDTWYGHVAGPALGPAFGSACPTGTAVGRSSATGPTIAKTAAARHAVERKKDIVCAE
uniref:L308_C1_151 n=1 Tax=Mycobacterium leprae TaxID=1769 RepID=Q49903_MYCLR|nr:L308_C1_151 [Mycobacterium leprae]